MNHLSHATFLFTQNKTLSLENDRFIETGVKEKIRRFLSAKDDKKCIEKVSDFIQRSLAFSQNTEKEHLLSLADAFTLRYRSHWRGNKIAQALDRNCVQYRTQVVFNHHANVQAFKKWTSYGMSSEIYHKHPEFCTFLEKSPLLSHMKVTKDRPVEVDGEPAILVEEKGKGKLMKWSQMKERFDAVFCPDYKETFIVSKNEVYTYLDNGKGLQKHHPFNTEMTPISVLTDQEYRQVLAKAQKFVRSGEETLIPKEKKKFKSQRTFIIQVVTSYVDGNETNAIELLQRRKHPYLRLIIGSDSPEEKRVKGEVFEFGYGWKSPLPFPFVATQGRFRSPDVWEYNKCLERVVTNIPVSKDEADAFLEYTIRYHREGVNLGNSVGFHLAKQNCSTYARSALAAANIKVPTEIKLSDLIDRIAPDWFNSLKDSFKKITKIIYEKTLGFVAHPFPQKIKSFCQAVGDVITKIALRILEAFVAFSLIPANVALGGASGKGGLAFVPLKQKSKTIKPGLADKKRWFSLATYRYNLPGILQEWQRGQPSTVIYKQPLKLAIVP